MTTSRNVPSVMCQDPDHHGCPLCTERREPSVESKDEDLFFEIYWAMRKRKSWERGLLPSEAGKPCPEAWGDGFKHDAREAWMARASLHVSRAR